MAGPFENTKMRPECVIDTPCVNYLELRPIYIGTWNFTEYLGQGLQGLPRAGPSGSTKMRPECIVDDLLLDTLGLCQLSRVETCMYRIIRFCRVTWIRFTRLT